MGTPVGGRDGAGAGCGLGRCAVCCGRAGDAVVCALATPDVTSVMTGVESSGSAGMPPKPGMPNRGNAGLPSIIDNWAP